MQLVPKYIVIRRVKYFNSDRMCVIISFRRWFGANVWFKFSWGFDKGLVFILAYFCSRMFIFSFWIPACCSCLSVFLLICFCFCVFAFPASLFFWFYVFCFPFFFAVSPFFCVPCFSFLFLFFLLLSLLLCFFASLLFLLLSFLLLCFSAFFYCFSVSFLYCLCETLEKPQMKPKYILKRS